MPSECVQPSSGMYVLPVCIEVGTIEEEAPGQLLGGQGDHACCGKNRLQSNLA